MSSIDRKSMFAAEGHSQNRVMTRGMTIDLVSGRDCKLDPQILELGGIRDNPAAWTVFKIRLQLEMSPPCPCRFFVVQARRLIVPRQRRAYSISCFG